MDELIIRVISGSATPEEEERVRAWCGASSENRAHFQDTERVWAATEPTRARASQRVPPSAGAVIAAAEAGAPVTSLERARAQRRLRGPLRTALALAAGVAAVALGSQLLRNPAPALQPVAVFQAEVGAARTIPLDDGSIVRLAPGSRLSQWEGDHQRRFSLTGRAFFAVAHDPGRPFVVGVDGAEATVLGTRFELLEGDGNLRVAVLEGRVALSNEAGRVEVAAGAAARASGGGAPEMMPVEDVRALLDWPNGLLVFQGTPLAVVAEEVSRHFQRTLEVRGDALRGLSIAAFFEQESFEEVVLALCEVAGATCSLNDAGARMEPQGGS